MCSRTRRCARAIDVEISKLALNRANPVILDSLRRLKPCDVHILSDIDRFYRSKPVILNDLRCFERRNAGILVDIGRFDRG